MASGSHDSYLSAGDHGCRSLQTAWRDVAGEAASILGEAEAVVSWLVTSYDRSLWFTHELDAEDFILSHAHISRYIYIYIHIYVYIHILLDI